MMHHSIRHAARIRFIQISIVINNYLPLRNGVEKRHSRINMSTSTLPAIIAETTEHRDYQSDYDKLLTSDTSVSLQLKRQRLIALEVFKILTKQCPSYLNDLIKPLKDTGHNLRTKNVEPPHFKSIKYGKKSFSYSGSKLWNNLPPCLQQSNHFEHFKKQISSWDGTKCKCSMCKYDVA